jgi:hypothetical protein
VQLGPHIRDGLVEDVGSIDPVTGRITAPSIGTPKFAVTTAGLGIAGKPLASKSVMTLYRVAPPLRLANAVEGVTPDGWMGSSASYTEYASKGEKSVDVTLSREAWGGEDVPGRVTIRVGKPVCERWRRDDRPAARDAPARAAPPAAARRPPAGAEGAVPRRGHRRPDVLASRTSACRTRGSSAPRCSSRRG